MARARKTRGDRTVAEPDQRELFQQQHHDIRRFEIIKSTPVGLVFPQNLQLELRDVDAGICLTGHSSYLSSGTAPTYVTSNMQWWKVGLMLPPTFHLFSSHPRAKQSAILPASEIVGLPPSPSHDFFRPERTEEKPWPLMKIKYPGWQGVTQMEASLTAYKVSKWMNYDHDLHSPSEVRSRWTILRVEYTREYIMACVPGKGVYRWLGDKKVLDLPEVDDCFPKCNGNLKLEAPDGRLLAVYKQRRDSDVLGGLTVFMEGLKEELPLEVVVSSCLAIVLYERVGWQNMFGD